MVLDSEVIHWLSNFIEFYENGQSIALKDTDAEWNMCKKKKTFASFKFQMYNFDNALILTIFLIWYTWLFLFTVINNVDFFVNTSWSNSREQVCLNSWRGLSGKIVRGKKKIILNLSFLTVYWHSNLYLFISFDIKWMISLLLIWFFFFYFESFV